MEHELLELKTLRSRIRFVINPGNAGDGLIGAATWQLFDCLGIAPTISSTLEVQAGDVAIYPGGGNLVPEYDSCRKFLEHCLAVGVERVLILPHSIRGNEELLARLDHRFTLFCREEESFDRVRTSAIGAKVLLAPDVALRLDVELLRARCSKRSSRQALLVGLVRDRQVRRYLRWRRILWQLTRQSGETLRVFRSDDEALPGAKGNKLWDLSGHYWSRFRTREEYDFVSADLLSFIQRSKTVVTNRLHVGIAGALVGRTVNLKDNSYGKIRAVYNSWLRDLENVSLTT